MRVAGHIIIFHQISWGSKEPPPIYINSGKKEKLNESCPQTNVNSPNNSGCDPNDSNCDREYRERKSNQTGKQSKNDTPSWAKGEKPYKGENGNQFVERVMNNKYGKGNWSDRGARSEFSQLKKHADSTYKK